MVCPRNNHREPTAHTLPMPGLRALIDAKAGKANRVFSMNRSLLRKCDKADLSSIVWFAAMGRSSEGIIAPFQRVSIERKVFHTHKPRRAQSPGGIGRKVELPMPRPTVCKEDRITLSEL